MIPNIYDKITIPKKYHETSIKKIEAEFIYSFLKKKDIKNTLEIGLAYGCSAAYIISATKSIHHVIDPYQNNIFKNSELKRNNLRFYYI